MKRVFELEHLLLQINNELKDVIIDDRTHHIMSLLNQRIKIGKETYQLKWRLKTKEEKDEYRLEDLRMTKEYFNKYGSEVKDKLLYKELFCQFVYKINELKSQMAQIKPLTVTPLIDIIAELVDEFDYIEINNSNYLNICFSHLSKLYLCEDNSIIKKLSEIEEIYSKLKALKFS